MTQQLKENTTYFCNYITNLQFNNKIIKDKIILLNSLNDDMKMKINEFIMIDELKSFIDKEAKRLHLNKETYFNSLIYSAFDVYEFYKKKLS